MNTRKESLRISFVLAAFGLLGLLSVLTSDSISTIRPVNVIRLLGVGMTLGAAIVSFAWHIHGSPTRGSEAKR